MRGLRGILKEELGVRSILALIRFTVLPGLAAVLASAPAVYGQQASPQEVQKTDKASQAELVKKPEPPHLPDIVSDNLDRVSATAEQILEIVDRDPGMMVELLPPELDLPLRPPHHRHDHSLRPHAPQRLLACLQPVLGFRKRQQLAR